MEKKIANEIEAKIINPNLPYKTLAELLRPQFLEDVIGQQHLLENNGALQVFFQSKKIPSLILFGPPGVGKTTIAKLLAEIIDANFIMISAITSGVADLKKIFDEIKNERKFYEDGLQNSQQSNLFAQINQKKNYKKTLLMVDEIHHFNKTQQDLFLPVIEEGLIIMVGTTTQNPSFHLNSALLSRCKVLQLQELNDDDLEKILQRAEKILQQKLLLTTDARQYLISLSCGDARYLINACEQIFAKQDYEKNSGQNYGKNYGKNYGQNSQTNSSKNSPKNSSQASQNLPISSKSSSEVSINSEQNSSKNFTEILLNEFELEKFITKKSPNFDKKGDFHFNLISAFHKSLRGSDVNSALYYLARMLVAKQDPFYIFRRLARFATEDIGVADPNAILQVMSAIKNYEFLGSPEGDYALSYATIYCANAVKSNACYVAHQRAFDIALQSTQLLPPIHICDSTYVKAVNKQEHLLEKNINELKLTDNNKKKQDTIKDNRNTEDKINYIYDHDTYECFSGQEYLPETLRKKYQNNPQELQFYQPSNRGFEKDINKRLDYWKNLKNQISSRNKCKN
jgi:putative ATPase